MTHDFEDLYNLEDLSDGELRALVRQKLEEYETLDSDGIVVQTDNGKLILSGVVGTAEERQIADHVLSDVLGIAEYHNNLLVASVRRDEEPEGADEASTPDGAVTSEMITSGAGSAGPEDEHLDDDPDARMFGSQDVQSAIEHGTPWIPPVSPTAEGRDAAPTENPAADQN
jgi:hypothetical protein